jgi:hypothetical protein
MMSAPAIAYLHSCGSKLVVYPKRHAGAPGSLYLGAYSLGDKTLWDLDRYVALKTGSPDNTSAYDITIEQFNGYYLDWCGH